jgi:uncharacterized protein (DUF1330 family)
MPAYVIAQMQVQDTVKYREYSTKVGPTLTAYGGRILAASDTADVREGTQPYPRTVIGEFPTADAARAWYESAEYQAILPLRLSSTTGILFIVEGFSIPTAGTPKSN